MSIRMSPALVRATCEFMGRIDAATDDPRPECHPLAVCERAKRIIRAHLGRKDIDAPERGAASMADDWWRWYLDAYENELGNGGRA